MDRIINEDIGLQLTDALEAKEGRLMVWTCTERDSESISGRMLRLEVAGRRPGGRAARSFERMQRRGLNGCR